MFSRGSKVREFVLMHLKAYAVDGQVLRTGSGNFSRSALADQDDLFLMPIRPSSTRSRPISTASGRAHKL
jgi:hypothetical protein